MPVTPQQQVDLDASLEQRADYIPVDRLVHETATGSSMFGVVHRALISSALKTLVGPRGCGKTHMMRYAWLECLANDTAPFAIYASFNKYYRLEPLMVSRTSPPDELHAWTLALVVLATYVSVSFKPDRTAFVYDLEQEFGLRKADLETLMAALERNQPLTVDQQSLCRDLHILRVQQIVDRACLLCGRKRTVLLLDDAAFTLTPAYLVEMLDIVRALKTPTIAPKASVYPGTTEYSPRFHAGQDSTSVYAWLSVELPEYGADMDKIAQRRIPSFDSIPSDVKELLRFAAFGIPRAYLTMLQAYREGRGTRSSQRVLNQVIEAHLHARRAEFRSLAAKVPKLAQLIEVGEVVLDGMVRAIKAANTSGRIYWVVGVVKEDITAIAKRMFQLLEEAGLVYDAKEIKHGTPERIYQRYIPHGAALLQSRALTYGDSGGTLRATAEALGRRREKHPVRRKLAKLVDDPRQIEQLDFSLPPCRVCSARRENESQKFCSNCGAQLLTVSTFEVCLNMTVENVPGLTVWQIEKIKSELPKLQTIRDYLAMQDPASELMTIYGVGRRRSAKIADVLASFVDDFLS